MEGGTSSAACGWISQLDVCQLLSSGYQVVYLVGLNGCEVPLIMSLPKLLAKGTTMLGGEEFTYMWTSINLAAKGQESKDPSPGSH